MGELGPGRTRIQGRRSWTVLVTRSRSEVALAPSTTRDGRGTPSSTLMAARDPPLCVIRRSHATAPRFVLGAITARTTESDNMRIQTITGRQAAILGALLALLAAGCSGSPSTSPSASPAASPGRTTANGTPNAPAATPVATSAGTPLPTDSAGTCPSLPADLATIRDLAKAGRAVGCFGNQQLTFRAYVPTTDGLGGVPSSKMTPSWIADPWTGAILQPAPPVDQSAWFVVRVTPALGKCRVTDEGAAHCPFATYLDAYATVTGHFNDAAASTCKSVPLAGQTDPGPSKSKMVSRCRKEFVVTAIAAG